MRGGVDKEECVCEGKLVGESHIYTFWEPRGVLLKNSLGTGGDGCAWRCASSLLGTKSSAALFGVELFFLGKRLCFVVVVTISRQLPKQRHRQ